jgi:hypothetical protein
MGPSGAIVELIKDIVYMREITIFSSSLSLLLLDI